MARGPRPVSASGVHHVMNRGVDRMPIFFADEDRIEFGRRLGAIHQEFGVTTLAYCLMGNHYHLLLSDPDGQLSEAMHHLGSLFARHVNDRIGRDGPLFRGRFLSIPVEDESYLIWVARYIHRNPVDLPADLRTYRWSSYRTYLGLRAAPSFLETGLLLGLFDGDRDRLGRCTEAAPGTGAARSVSARELRTVVAGAVAAELTASDAHGDAARAVERTLYVLLLDRLASPSLRLVAQAEIDAPTPEAARMVRFRARRRLAHDPLLRNALSFVVDYLADQRRPARNAPDPAPGVRPA